MRQLPKFTRVIFHGEGPGEQEREHRPAGHAAGR